MASDLGSDTCVGFKRRIRMVVSGAEGRQEAVQQEDCHPLSRESCDVTRPNGEEEHLAEMVSVAEKSSILASDSITFFQKRVKCNENVQETGDCGVVFAYEVVEKRGSDEDVMLGFDRTVVQEPEKHLGDKEKMGPANDELGLSGVKEFGGLNDHFGGVSGNRRDVEDKQSMLEVQMDSFVEDGKEGLVTSPSAFKGSQEMLKESFLKIKEKGYSVKSEVGSISEGETIRIIKVTQSESSTGIVGASINVKEGCQNMSQIDGKNGIVETHPQIADSVGKGSWGEEMHKMAPLQCSLNIEVIDETALIQSPSVSINGNGSGKETELVDCAKNSERNGKKSVNQETNRKEKKKSRRKGKGAKKVLETCGKQNIINQMDEPRNVCQGNGVETRRIYSRKQMEALRFVNSEGQKKMWNEIYCGLGPVVAREYDDLANCTNQKLIRLNFDPRQRFGKNEEAPAILRGVCSQNVVNETESLKDEGIENVNPLEACGHGVSGEDGYTDVEGECSEDSDGDEYYSSIQRPAFLVEGEPNFDSGPPEDGLEYLRRVRWEAAQIPNVKVAKLDKSKLDKEQTVYMPKIPDIAECPEHLLPVKTWEDAFLADFSELRLALSGLEGSNAKTSDKLQSLFFFHESRQLADSNIIENFNNATAKEVDSSQPLDQSAFKNSDEQFLLTAAADDDTLPSPEEPSPKSSVSESSTNSPTLSAILGMDSAARVCALRRRISSVEPMSTLLRADCLWLFALCAAVDTPLDGDTCASLRCLLRKCASLRAGKSELDDEVVMLNILATISGRYFGQSEK